MGFLPLTRKLRLLALAALILTCSTAIFADIGRAGSLFLTRSIHAIEAAPVDQGCPEHFAGGRAPEFTNPKLAVLVDAQLCFRSFAVYHSARARTPLWSAEHLTRQSLDQARALNRDDAFHEEERIAPQHRAWLRDYRRSGFDRGHMVPSADAPTREAQHETFSLANMVPQNPKLNRGIWEGYESAVRDLTRQRGELFVVTGPLFEGANLQTIGGRVLVPTSVYKVVFDPSQKRAAAIVCLNDDSRTCSVGALPELERRSGIRFFPGVTFDKNAILQLPPPKQHYKD